MTPIPVVVAAKNEERAIARTLEALTLAQRWAEARSAHAFDLLVALDDTTDRTEDVARAFAGVAIVRSSGGKVEAQRAGLGTRTAPFAVFCDADVIPSQDALFELASLLESRPEIEVATCPLRPLPPRRTTVLANALHTYNLRRGFSSQRAWFNGKLFAIRRWVIPERSFFAARDPDPFYEWHRGVVADDIYLSRVVGPHAIAETPRGEVLFRAPETWRGMNRYYRRMRREIERIDVLCPATSHVRREQDLLAAAPLRERVHHAIFNGALALCRASYVAERAWVRRVTRTSRPFWPAIEETKA